MTSPTIPARRAGDDLTGGRRHGRRWRRIALILLAAGAVLVALVLVAARPGPGTPALSLPASASAPDAAPLDGTWTVSGGSTGGFRVVQTMLAAHSGIAGRTDRLTGSATLAGGR